MQVEILQIPDTPTASDVATDKDALTLREHIPKYSKFSSAVAEGDINMKKHNWEKALNAYTKALELNPSNKSALVSRSKCFMNLGRFDNAIEDADAALSLDTKYYKGFLQKAESLYACGKFEFALVYYYKGFLLRKDIQDFRRGIRKAKIAINESIEQDLLDEQISKTNGFGNIVRERANLMETLGTLPDPAPSTMLQMSLLSVAQKSIVDASTILARALSTPPPKVVEQKMSEMMKLPEKDIKSPLPPHMTEDYPGKMGVKPMADSVDKKKMNRKNLLGEFSADEKYLQDLLKDKTFKKDIDGTTKDSKIYDLVSSTLSYLEKRKQFWKHSNQAQETSTKKSRPSSASSCPPSMLKRSKSVSSSTRVIRATSKRVIHPISKKSASTGAIMRPVPSVNTSRYQKSRSVTGRYSKLRRKDPRYSELSPVNSDSDYNDYRSETRLYVDEAQELPLDSLKGLKAKVDKSASFDFDENNVHRANLSLATPDRLSADRMKAKVSSPLPLTPEDSLRSNSNIRFDVIHRVLTPKELSDQEVLVNEVTKMRELILNRNFKEAETIAKEMLAFLDSTRANNPKEQQIKPKLVYAEIYSLLGDICHLTNREPQAIVFYKKAVQFTHENGYMDAYLTSLTNLANLYESKHMLEQAIEVWDTKRRTLTQLTDRTPEEDEELLNVYDTIGQCYEKHQLYDRALEVYKLALEESIAITTYSKLPPRMLESLAKQQCSLALSSASIHLNNHEFPEAVDYFERYLDLGRKYHDLGVQAKALTCLGNTYLLMSKHMGNNQPQQTTTSSKKQNGTRQNKDEYISRALYYQREAIRLQNIQRK